MDKDKTQSSQNWHERCSLCGQKPALEEKFYANNARNGFICSTCSTHAAVHYQKAHYDADKPAKELPAKKEPLKPKAIYNHLNEYVIGQSHAKKVLSVAVYNHYKRLWGERKSDTEIGKSNCCLIGPTGTGKTLLAQTVARFVGVPFAIGDATTLTEAGYVGEDVENLILKLLHAANMSVDAAEQGIIYIDEIDKIRQCGKNVSLTRDVSGEGVQRGLLKMIEGTTSNVPPAGGRKHAEAKFIPVNTTNILFIVGGAFSGIEDLISKRLNKNRMGFSVGVSDREKEKNELLEAVTHEDLIDYGFMPEFVGRLPILTSLKGLSKGDMIRILTEPKNALLKQYQELFTMDGCTLEYTPAGVEAIVEEAVKSDRGARALRSVCEKLMLDIMFEAPEHPGKTFTITDKIVKGEDTFFSEGA